MWNQIITNTLISGLLLSLLSVGFNLIFNATGVFHLAMGATYALAIYSCFAVVTLGGGSLAVGFIVAIGVAASSGIAIERLLYRPLFRRAADPTITLVASLAVFFLLTSLITFFFGSESVALPDINSKPYKFGPVLVSRVQIMQVIISLAVLAGVYAFTRTVSYLQIRAISNDYLVAQKFGINIYRIRMLALGIGSALAGIAGLLKAAEVATDPYVGLPITLSASVAVIAGGSRSLSGAVILAFGIAVLENFSLKLLSAPWLDTLIYGSLLMLLVMRKHGLHSVHTRVEYE